MNYSLPLVIQGQSTVPTFTMTSYSASVMENASIGTTVLSVVAQPAASTPVCSNHSSITYSTIPPILSLFSIESNGTIVITEHLDFETQQFHIFQALAQDGCGQATAEVNITVLNVDDAPPWCLSHVVHLSISESSPPSNTTFGLHCTDPDDSEATVVYTIIMGNDAGDFDISGGYLSTLKQLNYESSTQHVLLIHVTKTTYPLAVTEVTIIITVLASNEFPPVFSSSVESTYNISESLAIGSIVANVTAQDDDNGYDGIVTYSLSSAQDCFTMDPVSGDLVLLCILDREIQDVYYVTILAKDNPVNDSFQRSSNVTVELNVLDVNDNAPRFLQSLYTVSVLETVTNTVLLSLHCSDTDVGVNANITYYIMDGNSLNHFSVHPLSGNLSVGVALDYESQQFYRLKVQCFDDGEQRLSSTASVIIQVLSVDEYDPVIQLGHSGLYHIAEDSPVGMVIVTVSATDLDSGPAGEIMYSINRTNDDMSLHCPRELFEIDPISGSLYLLSTLDKESVLPFIPAVDHTYQCPLVVSNQQPDSRQASDVLRLSIRNVNDVAPVCDQHLVIVEIFEDLVVGSDICSITCRDNDSPTLIYSIVDPSIPFSVIFHNSTHVVIRLSRWLDYETQTQYSFKVVISDGGMPPLSTTVMVYVNIKNVNEHAPVFLTSSDTISIPEDTRVGTVLYTFSASDDDSDGDLHYTVVRGNDLVVLDGVTGALYLVASLDYEIISHFNLTVQAGDLDPVNPLTSITYLNVTITDVNDNIPVFTSLVYYVSLVETTLIGSSFNLPICTDSDEGVNSLLSCQILLACSYAYGGSCVSIAIDSSPFSFNFSIGEGIVTSVLDYEVVTMYMFEVSCRDQGRPELSASTVVYIEIVPINEFTPSFDSPSYNVTVAEDVPVGSSFMRVIASDLDSGLDGELSYSLSSDLHHFVIDPNTGLLFVTQHLDWEQEMSYTLQVTASDNSPNSSRSAQVNIYVTVNDVNDNYPFCEQETVVIRISELTTPVGSPIIQLNCSDADQLDSLHYTILSGNGQQLFSIHNNGTIVLSSVLDMPEYRLTVSVTDSSPSPLSVTVNCFVYVNRANRPPVFDSLQPSNVSLPLSTPPGTLLLSVTANDRDGDVINYSVLPSTSFLKIDQWSGGIYLITSLLRSQVGRYVFVLRVMDTELSSTLNLTLEVIDDISYLLRFRQSFYFVSVAEDTGINTTLLTVHCTDNNGEDIDNLQYYFPEPNTLFHIVQSTGLLSVSGSLDFELEVDHNISVVCIDPTAQSLHSTATVMVTILPVNEHTPILTYDTLEINVSESSAVGQRILQVNATDQDRDSQLRYYLNENFSLFYLDAISGVLYLIGALDYESRVSYNLSVTVVDEALHSSIGSVIIHVTDSNDHSPVCDPSFITKIISDDVKVGESVAILNCNDHDSSVNSQLQFLVVYSNSDTFAVNKDTGEIFVARELNASTSSCFLTILVSDKGTPVLTFTVAIEISVQTVSQLPNDTSVGPLITANDEGKNNSLVVTFAHLTFEVVSDVMYVCMPIFYVCVYFFS